MPRDTNELPHAMLYEDVSSPRLIAARRSGGFLASLLVGVLIALGLIVGISLLRTTEPVAPPPGGTSALLE
ncbi:hypothetical protein [Salipiger mucosus]|uniref:Uncharacterized protein n=1 Tax=Salipiger mucosus DSM 16094 TaxID=1123237 RepID=S9QQX8_9RHOB|nr:hypothetical protein [Salipiger mucosus]EPX82047.1 hypothetical protein Salmuc_02413 [Salipiger mucosus DSM 16094]